MAELKTKPTGQSVEKFINEIKDEQRKKDCIEVMSLMKKITKDEPKMWGSSIVGFGDYRYKYSSGREGDWFIMGFSPRKQNLTLYIMAGIGKYKDLTEKLGKHKTGGSCLYINKLSDINLKVFKELLKKSCAYINKTFK